MEKIKGFMQSEKGKDIMIVIIVILVGLSSFELGRLSKETNQSGIKILNTDEKGYSDQNLNQIENQSANVFSATNSTISNSKTFFASSRGSKYYSLGCSGGKTIKQENRIYFATKEEAERAGYELSSTCN